MRARMCAGARDSASGTRRPDPSRPAHAHFISDLRPGRTTRGIQRCSGSRVWRMAGRLTNVVSTSSTNSSSAALPLLDAQRIVSYLREA